MTEEAATTADLSVAMTTTGASRDTGSQFYFQCAVVVVGVIGTATNGLIFCALVASKQHKKHVLIANQNALDLFGSFFLTVTYSLRLCDIYLTGSVGYWLCTMLLSDNLWSCGYLGSSINLAVISVERYLKVVHRTWSKKNLSKWMIYSAAAFAWIGSIVANEAVVLSTTKVIGGACYAYAFWENNTAQLANII